MGAFTEHIVSDENHMLSAMLPSIIFSSNKSHDFLSCQSKKEFPVLQLSP
jgi:hypothetical protein